MRAMAISTDALLEQPPITFKSAAEAVQFADGLLHGDADKHKTIFRDMRKRRGNVSYSDLKDLAHSISIELAKINTTAGRLYRHIHGRNTQVLELQSQLARAAWHGPGDGPVASRKTIAQARDLALLVLADARLRARGGKGVAFIDFKIGMRCDNDKQFFRQWGDERQRMRDEINRLMTQAEDALWPELERIGVLSY